MPETELFSILDSIDSTNNYAMAKVHERLATHGMAWFAKAQTAGKGQRGKQWHTGEDENIALSIVLQPSWLNPSQQFHISVAVSLGCYDFFSALAGEETTIKWPNDIYWRDRKAGGILIENVLKGKNWTFSIVGMGVNINNSNFNPSLKNAVSLSGITGKSYDTVALAKGLYGAVMKRVEECRAGNFNRMLEAYNNVLYKKDKPVKFKKENIGFEGTVKSVSGQGKLIVTTGAVESAYDFGELVWRP